MVMADFIDRDRGRRRRRRGFGRRGGDRDRGYYGQYGERDNDEDDDEYPPMYPLKILAKPFNERATHNDTIRNHVRDVPSPKQNSRFDNAKQVVMLKSNEESRHKTNNISAGLASIPNLLANDTMPAHVYREKRAMQSVTSEGGQVRLAAPPEMIKSMKLIDENMNWCEGPVSMLLDQTDFLTVGILGLQGVGKSTLMSILAGNDIQDQDRPLVFKPQCKDARDVCSHQTFGVDMFVTGERAIFLDTQPMLSASILDCMIHKENKFSADYNTAENSIEIQSLQLASFMMTACNVVLVVIDWFADLNMLKLIETAEMLKPTTPSTGQDNNHESGSEFYPQIVFVLNGASSEDFNLDNYDIMQCTLEKLFEKSSLKTAGGLNMVSAGLMPLKRGKRSAKDINLILIPTLDEQNKKNDSEKKEGKGHAKGDALFSLMTKYRGHHTHRHTTDKLRHSLLAMPRQLITHTVLSEKNWFHYAARSWEGIKKSVLYSEYNRLLP